jgi:ATP-dependent protease ClpP protease subunit
MKNSSFFNNGSYIKNIKRKNNLVLPFGDDIGLNDEKDKELHSQYHSLFTENVPAKKMPLEDEEGVIPDVYQEYPSFNIFRFYVGDFSEEGVGLNAIMNKLSKVEEDDILEFHIDSNGGSINEGKRFYNLINNFQHENVVAMLNTGYSMGALLFCMTPIRIVHEFSDLMFHDYSTMVYGKAGDIETNHVHASAHVRNFFKKIILDKKFMTKEEFELMLVGKEFWMDTEEMCKRGIATHVRTQEGTFKAKDYLEKIEKERNPVKKEPIKKVVKKAPLKVPVKEPVKKVPVKEPVKKVPTKEPVKKEPVKKPSTPKK